MRRDGLQIPFIDLSRQHAPIRDELLRAVSCVAEAERYVLGRFVLDFEEAVAEYIGVRHAVGVASGSDALYLSLRAVDLQPDDEVITTAFSFIATAGAIENLGGRVVFADIEPRTFNLDANAVANAITDRTRAIVVVHLFGQMAEMGPILDVASQHGLQLIEDAAQAIGAKAFVENRWRSVGTLGALGCFSFYPTKNLGGWGDGGLVTTDDSAVGERVRRLRVHGADRGSGRDRHDEVGINSRLDAIQAAVLRVKLRHLTNWTELRRSRAAVYEQRLAGLQGLVTPPAEPDRFHVYNSYTIRSDRRDELRAFLEHCGIGTSIHYPSPLHLELCFAHLGYREGDLPEAERAAQETLSLPIYPELTPDELERVSEAIVEFCAG